MCAKRWGGDERGKRRHALHYHVVSKVMNVVILQRSLVLISALWSKAAAAGPPVLKLYRVPLGVALNPGNTVGQVWQPSKQKLHILLHGMAYFILAYMYMLLYSGMLPFWCHAFDQKIRSNRSIVAYISMYMYVYLQCAANIAMLARLS